jgi:YbbR domain-containing protein
VVNPDVSELTDNYDKNLQIEVLDQDGHDISEHFIITPSTVAVFIPIVSDLPSKNMAVIASVIGAPADGYEISRIITDPSTVEAFGNFEDLAEIDYLETEPIDITGLDETLTQTVQIVYADNISLSSETVTVVIQIESVTTARYYKDLIYAQNLASNLICTPPTISMNIVVSGSEADLDALGENDIVPYVDCSQIDQPGEYTLKLFVTLPSDITLVTITPTEVMITVEAAG